MVGINGIAIDGYQHDNMRLKMMKNVIGVAKLAIRFVSA